MAKQKKRTLPPQPKPGQKPPSMHPPAHIPAPTLKPQQQPKPAIKLIVPKPAPTAKPSSTKLPGQTQVSKTTSKTTVTTLPSASKPAAVSTQVVQPVSPVVQPKPPTPTPKKRDNRWWWLLLIIPIIGLLLLAKSCKGSPKDGFERIPDKTSATQQANTPTSSSKAKVVINGNQNSTNMTAETQSIGANDSSINNSYAIVGNSGPVTINNNNTMNFGGGENQKAQQSKWSNKPTDVTLKPMCDPCQLSEIIPVGGDCRFKIPLGWTVQMFTHTSSWGYESAPENAEPYGDFLRYRNISSIEMSVTFVCTRVYITQPQGNW